MLIHQFHHHIKPEYVEAYKAAILENVRETVKEPGILRFEVFQDKDAPDHFCLLEIYQDQAARESHLETPHFLKFKDAYLGQEMGARKGTGYPFDMLFPEEFAPPLPVPSEGAASLIDLAEKAALAQTLADLAEQSFPEMAAITQSRAGFLFVDDLRLLAPQIYPCRIPGDAGPHLEAFCRAQFQRVAGHGGDSPFTESAPWEDSKTIYLYPLRVGDNCFGMVGLVAQQRYTDRRKDLWGQFFHLFSRMVDRLIERQQTCRQLAHLNTYLTVSSMLSQPLGLHDMLEAVLYCSMDVVSAEAASVLLLDDEKQNFLFYQVEGPAKPMLDATTFPTGKGIAGSVYQNLAPEIINDVANDARFFGQIDTKTGFQTRNMIALPLVAGEEPVGVLEVINKMGGLPFTDDELFLLLSIAEEIAFAIRNAKIFDYVVESYCLQRQGLATCRGCKRPLGSWTPCVKYREAGD